MCFKAKIIFVPETLCCFNLPLSVKVVPGNYILLGQNWAFISVLGGHWLDLTRWLHRIRKSYFLIQIYRILKTEMIPYTADIGVTSAASSQILKIENSVSLIQNLGKNCYYKFAFWTITLYILVIVVFNCDSWLSFCIIIWHKIVFLTIHIGLLVFLG